jgi:hypothetical protein
MTQKTWGRKSLRVTMLVIAIAAQPARAQIGGGGTIQGTVTDPSGAVIPGVTIVATQKSTQAKTSRQATAAGYFVISPLAPGEYSVTATANGFQTLVEDRVVVDALATVAVNLSMKVGNTSETVSVTDTAPPVNSTDARVGQTLRNELYTALPLAMSNAPRDPTAFVQYLPGVVPGGSNAAGQVYGSQANSQEVYVEGMPITNVVVQGEVRTLGLGVSVEAVDQFQLESAGAAVQYGGMGSTNFVLKSGTNRFHGSAYEFFRNTNLDARGFFPATRPPEHQNEFGFNVSGPVVKNRLFFFGSYDGYRYRTGTPGTLVTVPSKKEKVGDFSELPVLVYDPATTALVNGVNTRSAFPNNVIPLTRQSKASSFLAADLPDPTQTGLQTNYLGSLPTGFNNWNTTEKVDYNLNERNTISGLFSRGHRSQSNSYRGAGNSLPLPYTDTRLVDEIPTTVQVKHTFVASPSLINQISYGVSRFWIPITNATIDGDWMTKAGVKGLPSGEAASSFPEITFSGPNAITGWRGTNSRAFTEAINTFTLQDNVQWTRGKHAVTIGVQMQWNQANEKTDAYGSLATWNFSNTQTSGFNSAGVLQTSTGNSYASYLLGALNSALVTQDSVVGTGARYKNFAWWVQDNFKVTSKLTLNLGVRHDIMLPYVEVLDRESFFNPSLPNSAAGGYPGILMFMGNGTDSCGCRTTVNTDYKLFGPRAGINYALTSKTVLRAGYTIMYTHRGAVGGRGNARTGTGTLGFSASPSFVSPDSGITPAFYWDQGVPAYAQPPFFDPTLGTGFNGTGAAASTMTYGDPSIGGRPPRYQNWNFGFEHAITQTLNLGVNYVGSNGHFLSGGGRSIWSDQINPKYLALGALLQATATPANIAAANAIIPGIGLPFAKFSGSISQMLRPFPQYSGITDAWGDVANSTYNSLQVTLNKRLSHGLVLNSNYVWSKAFGDDTGSRSAYNWKTEKAQQIDPANTINVLLVYSLPFGKGQSLASGNRAVDLITGGWQLSGITTYRSGQLIGTIAANCNTPNAGSCYADYNANFTGPVRIGGNYGTGDVKGSAVYLDKNAFVSPAPFTYGNTPRNGAYGIRGPSNSNQSVTLKREFAIRENWKLSLQADALNVFNWVRFANPNINITNANFGKITAVANSPRVVQIVGRFNF